MPCRRQRERHIYAYYSLPFRHYAAEITLILLTLSPLLMPADIDIDIF